VTWQCRVGSEALTGFPAVEGARPGGSDAGRRFPGLVRSGPAASTVRILAMEPVLREWPATTPAETTAVFVMSVSMSTSAFEMVALEGGMPSGCGSGSGSGPKRRTRPAHSAAQVQISEARPGDDRTMADAESGYPRRRGSADRR
jgi:hypothetical protein